jgi:hypothetical protein
MGVNVKRFNGGMREKNLVRVCRLGHETTKAKEGCTELQTLEQGHSWETPNRLKRIRTEVIRRW